MYFQKCDTTKFVKEFLFRKKQKAIFAWKTYHYVVYMCYY